MNHGDRETGPAAIAGLAFVFPGQGSQRVGMGKAWADSFPESRQAFAEADEALGEALSSLCFEGPEADLQLTANTQPAILAVSVAIARALAARGVAPALVAGHSLGEYSALVTAGSLGFADAVRLVRRRGRLMQEAVPVGEGAMAAVLGLPAATVEAVAREASRGDGDLCAVANFNSPEQTVIAGHRGAVERAMAMAKERGAKRALSLPVSAPFHSPLMRPAREALAPALAATTFRDPLCPVYANVDARPVRHGDAARRNLVLQVDGAVRWVDSVRAMLDAGGEEGPGARRFLEVGPGAVLTGLGKRIAPEADWRAVGEPAGLDELLATLAG